MTDTTTRGAGPAERAQHAGGDGPAPARRLPGRRRGVAQDPARRRPGRRDRPPEGQGRGSDHGQRVAGDQDRAPGGRPPFGTAEVEAMSRHVSPSTDRCYGVLQVTRVWGTSRATVYRHRRGDAPRPKRRPGPGGALPGEALGEALRAL